MDIGRRLSEGVGSWLQFESHCNRAGIFSEKYLSHPVGQILGAVYGSGVIAEYEHELLAKKMKGPGKRPKLDFGVINNSSEEALLFIETKWAGKTQPSVIDIIWDLIRLEMMLLQNPRGRAFFLLAGRKSQLTSLFESEDFRGPKGNPNRRPIMSYRGGGKFKLPLRPTQHFRVKLLRKLFAREAGILVPEEIYTKRYAPFPQHPKNTQYQVFVWEVLRNPSRNEFDPQTSTGLRTPDVAIKWIS